MSAAVQRQIALIAATVILIAAVVGMAVDAGEDDTAVVAVPSTTPIPTDEDDEKTPKPKATKKPAVTTVPTSTAPAATAAATPNPEGPSPDATPPKVGVYTYEETTNGETEDTTLRIADAGSGRQEEETDDGTAEVQWRDEGKYILTAEFGGFECDFEPDILEIKLPLKKGSSWSFDGKCEPFQGIVVKFKGSSKVTGTEKRTVGDTRVETWVIESKGEVSTDTPQGSFDMKITGSERFDPEHGLFVYSKGTAEGEDPSSGENVKESTTSRLKSLTPG